MPEFPHVVAGAYGVDDRVSRPPRGRCGRAACLSGGVLQLNPRVAAQDSWKRIEVLSRLDEFQKQYRERWKRRQAGERDVAFPVGTYHLRVLHGVRCEAA